MSNYYKITDQYALYFITLSVVKWIDIFSRQRYRDLIVENLAYCLKNKSLEIYAYVIMTNHIHLIAKSKTGNLSNTLRDFKSYTSKEILKSILEEEESRREWMIFLFKQAAIQNKRSSGFQFWTHNNKPILLESNKFISQKLNYIHNNPVKAGIVEKPEDYLYSSGRNYAGSDSFLKI